MNKRQLPFWIILLSLLFILIIRDLFRDGMFMDGMLYATVANNLASGLGSFWHPNFSQTFLPVFHEQPPLLFGIEAVFIKIFGHSIYVERAYGLLVSVLTIFVMHKLWRLLFDSNEEKDISWLPVIVWFGIPVCFWSFANNMEEPTMGLFDLTAVLFICKAIKEDKKKYFYLSIAAFMIIGASMCKGFQGLFPLAAIFFDWLVFRTISFYKMIRYSFFIFLLIVAFYGIILLDKTVLLSYEMYLNKRIFNAFMNPTGTHTDRFYIIKQLFSELIPVFILSAIGIGIIKIKNIFHFDAYHFRACAWLFLIALSGSLPLMLTIEQSGFYLVTAMPYFAIAFAIPFAPYISSGVQKLNIASKQFRNFSIIIWFVFFCSVIISLITIKYIPKRDVEVLHDVYTIGNKIGKGNIIGVPFETYTEWSLHSYYSRYFYISLDTSSSLKYNYFLLDKAFDKKLIPKGYHLINLPTEKFDLYSQ